MPKVKLLWSTDYSLSDLNSEFDTEIVQSITDWEDISDEDLQALNTNFWLINGILSVGRHYGSQSRPLYPLLIIKPDTDTIPPKYKLSLASVITELKEHVAKEEAKRKALEEEAEKKKAARAAKKEAKTLAEKKAMLEKLKQELGEE